MKISPHPKIPFIAVWGLDIYCNLIIGFPPEYLQITQEVHNLNEKARRDEEEEKLRAYWMFAAMVLALNIVLQLLSEIEYEG